MDDVEASDLLLDGLDDTNSADVTTSGDHGDGADLELEEALSLVGLEVELDGVVDTDLWVSVLDGPAVVGVGVWDLLVADLPLVDAAKLEFGLLWLDLVSAVPALGIIDEAELLVGLAELDDIHKTGWVLWIGADLAVDLDEPPHADSSNFTGVEGVLEAVPEENDDWEALASLVWASSWLGGELTSGLGKEPVVWGGESLKVLTLATWHAKRLDQTVSPLSIFQVITVVVILIGPWS